MTEKTKLNINGWQKEVLPCPICGQPVTQQQRFIVKDDDWRDKQVVTCVHLECDRKHKQQLQQTCNHEKRVLMYHGKPATFVSGHEDVYCVICGKWLGKAHQFGLGEP